ncbi:MAG: helix-turn-helix domain-containing protein [Gemmatimonadota bacterium]|nr:helix-turn-helix domain-containing protein [Gemmatimonadota bacterium]
MPALVLLSPKGIPSATDLIAIGGCGVHQVIDIRTPAGWGRLRSTLARDVVRERDQQALRELLDELSGAPKDLLAFAEALFDGYTGARTVQALARTLGVLPSTLVSRFFRARVPAPKQFIVFAGLVRAARLFENPGLTIADVATHLGHSSPQSFGRHIQTYMHMSAGEFRRQYNGVTMMRYFRVLLITPYRERLIMMSPLTMRGRVTGAELAPALKRAS